MDIHHYIHNFLKNRELNELYASISIRAFTISIIGVFIPIYLYQIGYSLQSILLFYIVFSSTHLLLSMPSAKIASRFGLKHSMLMSMPFLIVFFFLLYSIQDFNWPLLVLPIFIGTSTSLFWVSYHVDFSRFSEGKNRGSQIGFSHILISLFSILGPIMGALVLTFIGFKFLFVFSSLLLLGSVVPLFLSKEIHEPYSVSLKDFFRNQRFRDFLGYLGNGMEARLAAVIWPLFIFIFIFNEKYISLGIVASLSVLFSLISTFFIGRFADLNRRKLLKISSISNSVVWIFKSFVVTPFQVFFVDSINGITRTSTDIPFNAINYDKANKESRVRVILQREIYHHLGSVLIVAIIFFFSESLIEIFRYGGSISSLFRFFF